jgi:hypothetical protein
MRRSSRFNRPGLTGSSRSALLLNNDGDGSTLTLDFTTGVLDPRLTFTRGSGTNIVGGVTYVGSDGLVKYAGTNVPRFDHDPTTRAPRGLLLEGAASNLTRSSADLTNATYWTLQTAYAATSNTAGPSPDGTNNASSFTEPSNNSQRSIYQSYSSAAGTYTGSLWAKLSSGSTRYIRLVVSSAAGDFGYVTVNISTGGVQQAASAVGTATNASATVTPYPSGWYRITLTVTLAAAVNFMFAVPTDLSSIDTPTTNYGRISYLGNGSVFLLWGAQLETGAGASSLIPTGASTAQRVAEALTQTSGVSAWATSNTDRSYIIDATIVSNIPGQFPEFLYLKDAGTNRDQHYYYNSSGNAQLYTSGTYATNTWGQTLGSAVAVGSRQKMGFSIVPGTVVRSLNGAAAGNVAGSPPSFQPDALYLGPASQNSGRGGSIILRLFKYWPTAVPQATLNSITTL